MRSNLIIFENQRLYFYFYFFAFLFFFLCSYEGIQLRKEQRHVGVSCQEGRCSCGNIKRSLNFQFCVGLEFIRGFLCLEIY